jgi:hypothetical protein
VTVQTDFLTRLRETIAPVRRRIERHELYSEIRNIRHLRIFLESHVFAVWDFMSLLKSLQNRLTTVAIPWVPGRFPNSRRLINEIVLGEESDSFETGFLSHFELYLRAMSEAGADTTVIRTLVEAVERGRTLAEALSIARPPSEAAAFVKSTFLTIHQDRLHVSAAAFTFGREDLIPDMFHRMVKDLRREFEGVGLFEYYLDRHIDIDGDSHGPMALQMLEEVCGTDEMKWEEAAEGAVLALESRNALWDGILSRIRACHSA